MRQGSIEVNLSLLDDVQSRFFFLVLPNSVAAHGESAPDARGASDGVFGDVPLSVSVGDAPAVVEG